MAAGKMSEAKRTSSRKSEAPQGFRKERSSERSSELAVELVNSAVRESPNEPCFSFRPRLTSSSTDPQCPDSLFQL